MDDVEWRKGEVDGNNGDPLELVCGTRTGANLPMVLGDRDGCSVQQRAIDAEEGGTGATRRFPSWNLEGGSSARVERLVRDWDWDRDWDRVTETGLGLGGAGIGASI